MTCTRAYTCSVIKGNLMNIMHSLLYLSFTYYSWFIYSSPTPSKQKNYILNAVDLKQLFTHRMCCMVISTCINNRLM